MYLIRGGKEEVYNTVENPAVVFDKESGTLLKIGEKAVMQDYYEETQAIYRNNGAGFMADAMCLMDLPKDQEIIDRAFQNSGYVLKLYLKSLN